MKHLLYEIDIDTAMDVVLAHQKTIAFCKLAGFQMLEQTQMGTAVSEITRNTLEHADKGKITFCLIQTTQGATLEAAVSDAGAGIDPSVFASNISNDFLNKGNGIAISKKLVDHFHVTSSEQGTTILLQKAIPRHTQIHAHTAEHWQKAIDNIEKDTASPYEEIKFKNQQLIVLTTELEEKNEAIQQQMEEIKALNTVLDGKNQSLTDFTYTLSHDLKNPLSNIMALSQLARNTLDKETFLEKIEVSAQVMDRIIKGLMEIIDIDQHTTDNVKEMHFEDMVARLQEEYDRDLAACQGEVVTHFEAESIRYVAPYLESILRNLFSNAIKYHAERPMRLTITTHVEDSFMLLMVKDNGIGINLEKHRAMLFKPFKRFTRQQSGKGLGLHLIKKMIEKNGGSIKVESTPGEGTTFLCYLKPYQNL